MKNISFMKTLVGACGIVGLLCGCGASQLGALAHGSTTAKTAHVTKANFDRRSFTIPSYKNIGLFAIYDWMVFCFISTNLACFVQNLVDWAFGTILCIAQNTVGLPPGFEGP